MQLSDSTKRNIACLATAAVGIALAKPSKPLGITIFAIGVACFLYNLCYKKSKEKTKAYDEFTIVDNDGGISNEEDDGFEDIDLSDEPLIVKNEEKEKVATNYEAVDFILSIPKSIYRLFQGQGQDVQKML